MRPHWSHHTPYFHQKKALQAKRVPAPLPIYWVYSGDGRCGDPPTRFFVSLLAGIRPFPLRFMNQSALRAVLRLARFMSFLCCPISSLRIFLIPAGRR